MIGCGICFIVGLFTVKLFAFLCANSGIGYATHSIGADSPPVNFFELVTSDPPSQVALEKVRSLYPVPLLNSHIEDDVHTNRASKGLICL